MAIEKVKMAAREAQPRVFSMRLLCFGNECT